MTPKSKISVLIKSLKDDYVHFKLNLRTLIGKVESISADLGNQEVIDYLNSERFTVEEKIGKLDKRSKFVYAEIQRLINDLVRKNETVISDNYLLEYKKRDLLILADNLEEAYEEISRKNEELQAQKRQIQAQSEKLKSANNEIMNKNAELEQQTEFIMDQADYLHEANERITAMHEEVQKQKDEILSKNEELINLNNEKNNLIGIVAHDLKSPLNQIKGLISLIKLTSDKLGDDTQKYIDTIETSSHRLSEMIEKILDVEAIESKNMNLNIEDVDLVEVITGIQEEFKVMADQKGISIFTNFEGDKAIAELDKGFINQVFENLVSNAIKFSPYSRNIYLNLMGKDEKILCEVKDEGPGINESDMKKLFGKYQKLSARPTGNETSAGLGLSIVKKFVETMDGEIWCESEVNKGASFFVAFKKK